MRKQYTLDGNWTFLIDPKQQGIKNEWYKQDLTDNGVAVDVPHIWQSQERYNTYTGVAWYQKEFTLDELSDLEAYFIVFDAVDYEAKVWLNGQYSGRHEGGYTPFEIPLKDHVHQGVNRLTVRVYDPSDNAEIPIGKQGSWYTRVSGIWQSVKFEKRPSVHLKDIHIQISDDLTGIGVEVDTNKPLPPGGTLQLTVTEHLQDDALVTKNVSGTGRYFLSWESVRLWSPEDPYLYDVSVKLVENGEILDENQKHFGMRSVYQEKGGVWLNDKPLKIRGALDQGFYPDTIYRAPDKAFIIDEIEKAKQLGFNLLRKHIKIETAEYLYWADRMGMLIWEEPPNVVKYSAQANARFKKDLLAMIKRDQHHPSIIIWSIYNEEWGLEWDLSQDTDKQDYVRELFDEVRRMDPTRLICDNSGWRHVVTDLNDTHRYFTVPEQMDEWKKDIEMNLTGTPDDNFVPGEVSNQEPIVVSEFGVWGLPDPQDMIDYYGKVPIWYENLGDDTHKEDFKRPLTLMENFKRFKLNEVFQDYAELAECSQRRQFRANQGIIEEMRKSAGINGYVVTELTDIEWETNGWMDYARELKQGFENAVNFNGSLVIMAELKRRNMWSGDFANAELIISNHEFRQLKGSLVCEIPELELKETFTLDYGHEGLLPLNELLKFQVPKNSPSQAISLELELCLEDGTIAKNRYELTVTDRQEPEVHQLKMYTVNLPEALKLKLREQGFKTAASLDDADVILTSHYTEELETLFIEGKNIIFLAEQGDHIPEKGLFTFRALDQGESWNRTSSMNYVNTSLFPGIPLQKEMGWECDGLYPDYVIPMTNYEKAGGTAGRIVYMFGNDSIPETSEIIAGYFQGWAGQNGASMIKQQSSKGTLTLTTWKLMDHYGTHPVATSILNQLILEDSKITQS